MIPMPPRWMLFTGVLAALALAVPPFVIARVRATPDPNRAVHIFFDMDFQPKFKPQTVNPLFADGRAMRPPVQGSVARGESYVDTHMYEGVVDGQWATALPASMKLDQATLERGQQRFNIYCTPCHGQLGDGNGMVVQRGLRQAASYHQERLRAEKAGYFFDVITNGFGVMQGYAEQIPVRDRWLIVAYVRALQLSQHATVDDVPADKRAELDAAPASTERH